MLLSWCLGFVIIITFNSLHPMKKWGAHGVARYKQIRYNYHCYLHITNSTKKEESNLIQLTSLCMHTTTSVYTFNNIRVYIQQHPCIHSTTLIHFQNMLTEILIQLSFTLSANIHWVVAVFCFGLLLLLFYHCFVSVWGKYPDCIFSVSKPRLLVIVSVGAVICSFRSMFYNHSFLTQNDLATGKQSKLHDLLFEWFWLIETAL